MSKLKYFILLFALVFKSQIIFSMTGKETGKEEIEEEELLIIAGASKDGELRVEAAQRFRLIGGVLTSPIDNSHATGGAVSASDQANPHDSDPYLGLAPPVEFTSGLQPKSLLSADDLTAPGPTVSAASATAHHSIQVIGRGSSPGTAPILSPRELLIAQLIARVEERIRQQAIALELEEIVGVAAEIAGSTTTDGQG